MSVPTKRICGVLHVQVTCRKCGGKTWTQVASQGERGRGIGWSKSKKDRYVCNECKP